AGTHLAWTGGAGSAYQVRRAIGANGTFSSLATVAGTTFDDSDLIVGLSYAYQVVELDPSLIVTNTRTITATLTPPTVVSSAGGSASSTGGGASVTFAPGTFTGGAAVSVVETSPVLPSGIVASSKAPNPAEAATVTFTITSGPGGFSGGVNTCLTDATGACSVTLHSDHTGTTNISAAVTNANGASTPGPASVTFNAHTFDLAAQ